MSEKTLKKITFHKVYKSTKPYITTKCTKLSEKAATELGFCEFTKKNIEDQYYRVAPKTDKAWIDLKKKLKKFGFVSRIKDADDNKVEELGWKYFNGYEFGLKRNMEAERVSKDLVKTEKAHSTIVGCNIGHFFKSTPAPYDEETRIMTFAFATLANTMNEKFANLDFIIYYYEDAWDSCSRDERTILVDHELFHCAMDGTPYLRDHDIQEHSYIVDKYGLKPPHYHWGTKGMKRLLTERENEE